MGWSNKIHFCVIGNLMNQWTFICSTLFISLSSFGTDLLIVDKDTFYLKTYPLEMLNLTHLPFGIDKQFLPGDGQYPGYQAVWRISGGKWYLERVLSVIGREVQEENIAALFQKNGIKHQVNGAMIFADWLTITYYAMEPYNVEKDVPIFLVGRLDERYNPDGALVRVENGFVTMNKLPTYLR